MFSGIYDGSYQKGFIMKCIEEYFAIKKSHHYGATILPFGAISKQVCEKYTYFVSSSYIIRFTIYNLTQI